MTTTTTQQAREWMERQLRIAIIAAPTRPQEDDSVIREWMLRDALKYAAASRDPVLLAETLLALARVLDILPNDEDEESEDMQELREVIHVAAHRACSTTPEGGTA